MGQLESWSGQTVVDGMRTKSAKLVHCFIRLRLTIEFPSICDGGDRLNQGLKPVLLDVEVETAENEIRFDAVFL